MTAEQHWQVDWHCLGCDGFVGRKIKQHTKPITFVLHFGMMEQ